MEKFKQLIYELGQNLNIGDIEADEEGYIALSFNTDIVHLQYDNALDEVTVFTQPGEVEPDRLSDVCLMLLAANQFWQGTQGATFSIEPTTKMVFLAERQALSLLNAALLKEWLERFMITASYWNRRLISANAGEV